MYKLIFLNKITNIIRILAYKRSFVLHYLYLLIVQSYFISKKFLQTIVEENSKRSIKIERVFFFIVQWFHFKITFDLS